MDLSSCLVCPTKTHKHTQTLRGAHQCRGTEKAELWVRVSQTTNIIPLYKYSPANTHRERECKSSVYVPVVSFCLASSRHRIAGEASRLYLFINLLGTGSERQGQYIIAHTHTRAHKRTCMHTFHLWNDHTADFLLRVPPPIHTLE